MKRLFIGLILFMSLWEVNAQQVLSLEDCRSLAIENNKKLKISGEEIEAAKAKKAEAFTKYLPGIDAMGTYMRNQKKINLLSEDAHLPTYVWNEQKGGYVPNILWNADMTPVIGPDGNPVFKEFALLPKDAMTVDARNTALLQVGLTQPIYMGGKIRAYNQLAGLSEKLAESGYDQELQSVILETDEAYWQVISLVNRQKMAGKYVETLKKFSHDVEIMYNTGVATKAELLSVNVKLNEGEMLLTKVENGLSLSRMLLNQMCGLPTDTICVLKEEVVRPETVALPEYSLEQVYDSRPEIRGLLLATDIYKKKERIARSEYLPTVAFMANYLSMTPSFFDGISTKLDGMWSVGVGVKAPIFHWGASRKSVRSARAETNVINYKLQDAKEKIELQVSQSQFKVKEAAKKMEMAQKNMERAEENLKFANLGFQEGTIPASNVLEAQTAWLSARSELIDAQIESKLCEVYLQKAYGILGK